MLVQILIYFNYVFSAEVPILNVSYKPQKISPKHQGTVRMLLHEKIRDAYIHPQFLTDVMKPLKIEAIMDQEVCLFIWEKLQTFDSTSIFLFEPYVPLPSREIFHFLEAAILTSYVQSVINFLGYFLLFLPIKFYYFICPKLAKSIYSVINKSL